MRHLAFILSAMLLFACSQSLETTYSNQESKIDSFLAGEQARLLSSDEVPDGTGEIIYNRNSNRLVLVPGSGNRLSASGKATVYCTAYIFNGGISASNMIFTNHEETAEANGWTVTDPVYEPITLDMKDKNMIAGLKNGLEGVRTGEECYIVFSGKYGYGNKVHGKIPANSALLYHITVLSVE